jgi:hypothetical protein
LLNALASIPCVTKILVSAYLRSTIGDGKLKAAKSLAGDVRNRLGFADGEEVIFISPSPETGYLFF